MTVIDLDSRRPRRPRSSSDDRRYQQAIDILRGHPATPPDVPLCPDWCELPPGHGWDFIERDAGRWSRGHDGQCFGVVGTSSVEYEDGEPTELRIDIDLRSVYDLTPAEARRLAADLRRAAAWVEAVSE